MKKVFIILIAFGFFPIFSFGQDPRISCDCIESNSQSTEEINYDKLMELLNQRDYYKAIDLCYKFLAKKSNDQYSMQYLSEFLFYVAEIESGNLDPSIRKNMLYMDDSGESDPIGYEIHLIKSQIGPNSWTQEVKEKYLELLMCFGNCFRKKQPNDANFYTRHLAILIASKNYDELIRTMKEIDQRKINIDKNIGEYYARFTERFVGLKEYKNGLNFLIEVNNTYKVEPETIEYWYELFNRILENEDLKNEDELNSKLEKLKN